MARSRRLVASPCVVETSPIIKLWIARILINLGGHRDLMSDHGISCDNVAQAVGLGEWIDCTIKDFDRKQVLTDLRRNQAQIEREAKNARVSNVLGDNVSRLARLVGLNGTDCRILEFAVMIHNESILDEACDRLGQLTSLKLCHALSVILELPEQEVRAALGANGILAKSGLVAVDRSSAGYMLGKLDLLSKHFADLISTNEIEPVGLLRDTVNPGQIATLQISDFQHIDDSLQILRPFLKRSIATKRIGV